ncbi:MAG: HDOD domain-containing protein [Lentisphaeraceae bacterium]|nr:HDOD domain-containing protein [Lentisphaeraceae bacterium]
MGVWKFILSLFRNEKNEIAGKKKKAQVKESAVAEFLDDDERWWENPVHHEYEIEEFEALDNTVLFDELHTSLTESRLEIIEIPDNIAAIMGIVNRKNFKYPEVQALIEKSPVLTGDFISITNSAAFSRGINIYELTQALPRLGRQTIQSILFLNASKMSIPKNPLYAAVAEGIIFESQVVAKIARHLAAKFYSDSNEAFMAGLLHNIGKLGLLQQISKHYELPEDIDVEQHKNLFNNIFPTFYQEAGKVIARYWKLDERITIAISSHNKLDELHQINLEGPSLKLAALINLSVYLARILGYGEDVKQADVFAQRASKILKFKESPETHRLLASISETLTD